jgi:hypothetical protein
VNDFLTRLAQHCLGEAPAIRPRLPGLFGPLDEDNAFAADAATFDQRHSSSPDRAITLSRGTLSRRPGGDVSMEEGVDAAPSSTSRAPQGKGKEVDDLLVEQKTLPQSRHPSGDDKSLPGPARPLVEASRGEGRQSRRDRAAASVPTPSPPSSSHLAEVRPEDSGPPTVYPLFAAELKNLNARQDAPAFTAATAPAHREPAQMPAMHITIGRVEVRANMPLPPPSPRPRPDHKPALSLGDYLKRRGGRP